MEDQKLNSYRIYMISIPSNEEFHRSASPIGPSLYPTESTVKLPYHNLGEDIVKKDMLRKRYIDLTFTGFISLQVSHATSSVLVRKGLDVKLFASQANRNTARK